MKKIIKPTSNITVKSVAINAVNVKITVFKDVILYCLK